MTNGRNWETAAFIAVVACCAIISATESHENKIDRAQAAFEKRERAKFDDNDFDGWRKSGDMSCQNGKGLRICRAHPVVIATGYDGTERPIRQFVSFACSADECAWVDP